LQWYALAGDGPSFFIVTGFKRGVTKPEAAKQANPEERRRRIGRWKMLAVVAVCARR
jgi:hypothetical protein